MRRTRKQKVLVLATAVALCLSALFAAASTANGPTVGITGTSFTNYSFHPKTVTVNKGSTVHWSWNSNAPHNVTFKKLGKHSATAAKGTYKLKFKHAGTYKYLCTIHDFRGKVIVN